MTKKTRKRFDITDTNNGYVTLYDEYDKSAGYIIEKGNEYWTGKNWSDIKAYAESYKTKKEAEQKLKSTNMADGGKVLYMVSRRGNPEYPEYIIERTDGSEMIQMFFDTEEDAIKYAKAKGYNLTKKNIMAKKTRKRYDTGMMAGGGENFDFIKSAIESASGDKISHKGGRVELIFHGSSREIPMGEFESSAAAKRYVEASDWQRPYSIKKLNKKVARNKFEEEVFEYADGGKISKEYKLRPMIPYGVKGMITTDYKNSQSFFGGDSCIPQPWAVISKIYYVRIVSARMFLFI